MHEFIRRRGSVLVTAAIAMVCASLLLLNKDKFSAQASTGPRPAQTSTSAPASPTTPTEPRDPFIGLVLKFEAAYWTPDANKRRELLGPFVTPAFLHSLPVDGGSFGEQAASKAALTVHIEPTKSVVTSEALEGGTTESREVSAIVWVEMRRDGEVVNSFEAPLHTTYWIKTKSGWKAVQDNP